jgi:hypothetical protein
VREQRWPWLLTAGLDACLRRGLRMVEIRCLRPRRLHVLSYKIAISGLHKQWRRGAWDRLESLLRATASATPPSLVALSSSPSRGVAKTVAAMGAGLSAWPPGMQILCSVSDMTGAMPQPRRDTFTEFPARVHRGMIVRDPTAVMARSGGSSLRQLSAAASHRGAPVDETPLLPFLDLYRHAIEL